MEHNPVRLYRGPIGVALEPLVRLARGRGLARKHRAVWKMHRLVWLATRSNRVLIDGHDLTLDFRDSLALARGFYEPEEEAWYRQHVHAGHVVVEVGANIGYFTVMLARAVGETGRVISYEPDPTLNGILRENVARNGYAMVEVRQSAVADQRGVLNFYRSRKSQGDNRLFTHGRDGGVLNVDAVTLDEDLAELGVRVDLLKMDIQGAEPLALRGYEQTLESCPPRRMLIEFWPHGLAGMGEDPRAFVAQIFDAGYEIQLQDGSDLDLEKLLLELTPENLEWVNLVCTHRTAEVDE